MIPHFPKFKKLEISDKAEIDKYTNLFDPYSDFNFTSMFSYNTENDCLLSFLFGNLVVRFRNYTTNEKFYSFLGTSRISETIELLLQKATSEDIQEKLFLIPEVVYKNEDFNNTKYLYIEDIENYDYILSLQLLANPSGHIFEHKRWRIRNFSKNYPHIISRHTNITEDLTQKYISLFSKWSEIKGKETTESSIEKRALRNILTAANKLSLLFHTVELSNQTLIGFAITEIINNDYIIGHFMKADPTYKGLSESIFHIVGADMSSQGYSYINSEQYLGNQGLRYAKESWQPVKYLKKAVIKRK